MIDPSFSADILRWFKKNARILPWRDLKHTPDPYQVWISEIMLQQTTVATVSRRFSDWINRFPSISSLAAASEQSVLKAWQGLGYYTRARNVLKCAQILVDHHKGTLPDTVDALSQLPGFGPYTASAVASIAFDRQVPLVDANVRRVMMRILAINEKPSAHFDRQIINCLNRLIPSSKPGHFNQAMMELGALLCRSTEPLCNQCPVRPHCKAYQKGIQELIPQKQTKTIKKIDAVIAIIWVKNKVIIQQRPPNGLLAGLWEFPGGKVEPEDSSFEAALRREVYEETRLNVQIRKKLGSVTHYYTAYKVNLTAYECSCETRIKQTPIFKLVSAKEIIKYPMPSGSAKLVDRYLRAKGSP